MSIRGARILVAGACSPLGHRLVEAFLALGAHVIAADCLRTRLEELRAQMRQHERLWVAECDFGDPRAAQKLLNDVVRDEPLDTAIAVFDDATAGVDPDVAAAAAGCDNFLHAVIEVQARTGRGRVLIAISRAHDRAAPGAAPPPAFLPLLAGAAQQAAQHGIAVDGVIVALEHPAALAQMMALCDPERPAASDWIAVP